jgi:L-ascorbate metabolism protein UlaG (beta-lactamase superfamily)
MRHIQGMASKRRIWLKRLLLGAGASAVLGTWWVRSSDRRAARLIRTLAADLQREVVAAPQQPTPARWPQDRITLSWLGHATVLINFFGIHILTDPVFSNRIGVSFGLGTIGLKRYIAPALPFSELPPIDVVLLSHAHMDHMDLPTLAAFDHPPFAVTAALTRDLLARTPLRQAQELDWGGRTTFSSSKGRLEIEAIEVKHWGRRWPSELDRGYNGYLLRREGKSILFAGDTAITPLFREQHRAKGPFDVAIMPIGAYNPWIRNHCSPEQAVQLANDARAKYLVPVHHQTFRLSDEPMNEPIQRFTDALRAEPERVALKQVGETFRLPTT